MKDECVISFQKISSKISSINKPKAGVGCSLGEGTAFVGKENGDIAFLKLIQKLELKYPYGYDIFFADTLYSHNINIGSTVIKNEQAKKILDDWLKQHDFSIKNDMLYHKGLCVTKKGKVFRWDIFRNNNECKEQLEELKKLYFLEENQCDDQRTIERHKDFVNGVNETLQERKETFKKQNRVVEDKEILAYLLEEYAVLVWMAKTKGLNIFHYPGNEPAGLAATRRCFLDDPTLLNYSKITIGKKNKKIEKKKRREKKLELKNKISNNKNHEVLKQQDILLSTKKNFDHQELMCKNKINGLFFSDKDANIFSGVKNKTKDEEKLNDIIVKESFRKIYFVADRSCTDVLLRYPNDFGQFVDALISTINIMEQSFKIEAKKWMENYGQLKLAIEDLYIDNNILLLEPILNKVTDNGGFTGSPSSPNGMTSILLLVGYLKSNMCEISKQISSLLDQNVQVYQIKNLLKQVKTKIENDCYVIFKLQKKALNSDNGSKEIYSESNIITKSSDMNSKKGIPPITTASIKHTIYNNTGVKIVKNHKISSNGNW